MSNLIPGNHKHLSLADRQYIEKSLNERKSFREIAKYLCKDPSTISKEVWKHRIVNTWNRGSFNNPYNFCIHRYHCKKTNACNKLIICDTLCRSCHRCNNVSRGLKGNPAGRYKRLLMSAMAVISPGTSAPSRQSMIIMLTPHTECMRNFSRIPVPVLT